jgi:hypothetical protein
MTSILLCHFPGGACFGIIAPYVEAILRTRVCGSEFSDLMRLPVRRLVFLRWKRGRKIL